MSQEDAKKAVKQYWEDQSTISIIDRNLHQIEMESVSAFLNPNDQIADFGCGNGVATLHYAQKVKSCIGYERSENLLNHAKEHLKNSNLKNINFQSGDILDPPFSAGEFDVIVTQRLLSNLVSWEDQKKALQIIKQGIKPGGRYLMVDNLSGSFENLNNMREQVDLEPIKRHWHNLFFEEDQLIPFLESEFNIVSRKHFSLYYFLTRVYVPMFASFVGFGKEAVKDPIFNHSDPAARSVFEKFCGLINFDTSNYLGPIQLFVLEPKV